MLQRLVVFIVSVLSMPLVHFFACLYKIRSVFNAAAVISDALHIAYPTMHTPLVN